MSKFPSITPGINSQTGSAELRNQMLATFRNIDNRFLVTPGIINSLTSTVTTSGATETTLLSVSIGSDYLAKVGSSLLMFLAGTTAANANNKTLKFKLNTSGSTTVLFTIGPTAYNNVNWTCQWEVIRNGANTQFSWLQFFPSGNPIASGYNTGTVDLSGGGTLLITGQGTASADISLLYAKTQLLTT